MRETIEQFLKEFLFLQDVAANLLEQLILFLPKLIAGFIVMVVFYLTYRLLRYIIKRSLRKADISYSVTNLIIKVVKYTCLGLALILVADQIGIKIITLISTLGVAGIALGLAAQQTLANFISGIIILVSKPFRENDYVELEGTFGKVQRISLRSTMLITLDNLLVDIPNQKIVESKIVNHTFNEHIRLRIQVGIAYKEYIPAAQEVLLNLVKNDKRIMKNPKPEVVVTEIADSSINLEVMVWIADSRQEVPIRYDLRKQVKLALDEAKIQIPFPHRQLFLDDFNVERVKEVLPGRQNPKNQ
ncbi:mechanosensitive ion channel [candidate division KSB1 bacterium]|nr:mechanosensitive ion channel [candidate division KSB1 bacterium]